ncbi:MAG: hypothetical protein AB1644_03460 [Candidatus Zixiibacteriota bacterium]
MNFRNLIPTALALAVVALATSCEDKGTQPKDHPIVGNWRWVSSCGGFAYNCTWADSTGKFRGVTFERNGRYSEWGDVVFPLASRYHIVRRPRWSPSDSADFVLIDNRSPDMYIEKLTKDTLVLSEYCLDCFGHTYVRLGNI